MTVQEIWKEVKDFFTRWDKPVIFNNSFQLYYDNQTIVSNCAEMTFVNQGDTNVILNDSLLLVPGSSFMVASQKRERDITKYSFKFQGAVGNNLVVMRKYYSQD